MKRSLLAALLLAALLLAGCGGKVVSVQTNLMTTACDGVQPLDGVTHLEFIITGDGLSSPITEVFPINAHAASVPDIPPGTHRVVEVRGYSGDPAQSGRVISRGRSLPFDVPTVVPADGVPSPNATVVLRRVNAFIPPSGPGGVCGQLSTPRAGHSATVLADGRVFIAGGYQLDGSGQVVSLASAEVFDPATGAFSRASDLGINDSSNVFTPTPRAFQAAAALPSGQVLLAGGEVEQGGVAVPLDTALLYDPASNTYGALTLSEARSRGVAAADIDGHVLIAGGIGAGGAPASSVEWFDPSTARTQVTGDSIPRLGAALAQVGDGHQLALVGGSDGSTTQGQITIFTFTGGAFFSSSGPTLHEPRRNAAITAFQSPGEVLVVGGFSEPTDPPFTPLASTEQITAGSAPAANPGPSIDPRGDPCAVALADGQVLVAGGDALDFNGNPLSSTSAELITTSPDGNATSLGMPPLPVGRSQHTCTPLPDGSALILGGLSQNGGVNQVLSDALIFMPAPRQ